MSCNSVSRPTIQRCQRREVAGELWVDQLKELFGSPQILEPVGAEVQEAGTVREPVGHQGGRGARQQHLAPVSNRHDPSAADDRRTEVVVPPRLRFAGVQPHPHSQDSGVLPGLFQQTSLGS
jgi:hypothetical protein